MGNILMRLWERINGAIAEQAEEYEHLYLAAVLLSSLTGEAAGEIINRVYRQAKGSTVKPVDIVASELRIQAELRRMEGLKKGNI